MRISDSFIERVLSGAATEEEKKQVAEFFKDHPEKLVQYLTEKSWGDFNPDADTLQHAPTQKMLTSIENSIGPLTGQPNRGARVIKWRVARITAAAAVLLAGAISVFFWTKADRNKAPRPGIKNARIAVPREEQIAALRTIRNTTPWTRVYSLPDGSIVKLAAYSEVSFHQPFVDSRRDIFLKGEGVFNVSKNPLEPFAVHSKGITTTALGTVFSVNDQGSRFAIVRLFSGRIVVKKESEKGANSSGGAAKTVFKEVYLLPGQELVLNKENFYAQVKIAEPRIRAADTASAYPKLLQFTRQPLPDVLSLLQKDYKVAISYDSTGMKNMDFTGVFNHDQETIGSFLGTLCDLNGLILIKHKGNRFSIREK